jgi:hypothetical protein
VRPLLRTCLCLRKAPARPPIRAVLEVISSGPLPHCDLKWLLDLMNTLLNEGRTIELVQLLKRAAVGGFHRSLLPAETEPTERPTQPEHRTLASPS